jgi:hypothetical protein
VFNNAPALFQINGNGPMFGNWIALGLPQYNADGPTADMFLTTPGLTSFFVVQNASLAHINFTSIGLASATNDRTGGDVVFTFGHSHGTVDSATVSKNRNNWAADIRL